jgi:geranylgeranyl diphosphate synthase type II
MYSAEYIQTIIRQKLAEAEYDREPHGLYEPIRYMMDLSGKRLRPALCLLACDLFGGDIKLALDPAVGIEIFHNFTLMHDDIMDDAPVRRCKPTVYKKWNQNTAILSGDTMMALAYEYLMKAPAFALQEVLKEFNRTAIGVCEGQQYDMDFETQTEVTIDDYHRMIRLKTAFLIAGSLKIGAIIANAPPEDAGKIWSFGNNLGIAFQLKDDLLDVFSDHNKFGKMKGGDIAINKKTYLYLKSLELADPAQKKMLKKYFSPLFTDQKAKIEQVIKIYEELGIKDHVRQEMQKYHLSAMSFLSQINVNQDRKSEISKIAGQMLIRET